MTKRKEPHRASWYHHKPGGRQMMRYGPYDYWRERYNKLLKRYQNLKRRTRRSPDMSPRFRRFGHCLICGYAGKSKADFKRHLVEKCHWLSDENGCKWR